MFRGRGIYRREMEVLDDVAVLRALRFTRPRSLSFLCLSVVLLTGVAPVPDTPRETTANTANSSCARKKIFLASPWIGMRIFLSAIINPADNITVLRGLSAARPWSELLRCPRRHLPRLSTIQTSSGSPKAAPADKVLSPMGLEKALLDRWLSCLWYAHSP